VKLIEAAPFAGALRFELLSESQIGPIRVQKKKKVLRSLNRKSPMPQPRLARLKAKR